MKIQDHYLISRIATTYRWPELPKDTDELVSDLERLIQTLPRNIEIEDMLAGLEAGRPYLEIIYHEGQIIDSMDIDRDEPQEYNE